MLRLTAEDGSPLPLEARPAVVALQKKRASHACSGCRGADGVRRRLEATGVPARGAGTTASGGGRDPVGGGPGMKVTLWGTRGSLATPGPETVRYGGNTSCVEVCGADGTRSLCSTRAPASGGWARQLGPGRGPRGPAVDSPAHGSHPGARLLPTAGRAGQEVHIWGPPSTTLDLRARVSRYLSPPLFPVRLRELPCRLTLHDVPLARASRSAGCASPWRSFATPARPSATGSAKTAPRSLTFPTTSRCSGPRASRARTGSRGSTSPRDADLLIHDCPVQRDEYPDHVGWGHSTIPHALAFAARTGVKRLVTFHHDPRHDDTALDRMIDEARSSADLPFEILPGVEGACFEC